MKIELTEKEYNTIDDILYQIAHNSRTGGAYFGYGIYNIQSQQEQDIKALTILNNNFSPTATRPSGFL